LEQINDHIDELIGKYLAGEAVAEEIAFIESWASENESNRKYFDQFKTIFQKAAEVSDYQIYDTDAAWSKMKRSLRSTQGKPAMLPPSNFFQLNWRIAAAVILAMGVGLFLVRTFQPAEPSPVVVLSNAETVADTLPDGSGVVLNKQTKLAYEFDQKKKVHTVTLKGEGIFQYSTRFHQDIYSGYRRRQDQGHRDIVQRKGHIRNQTRLKSWSNPGKLCFILIKIQEFICGPTVRVSTTKQQRHLQSISRERMCWPTRPGFSLSATQTF
jgi:hypothetical protein